MKNLFWIIGCVSILFCFNACAQSDDPIIGVWEVNNEHYNGIYEVVYSEGKFYGKVHYYNDGTTEYIGNNEKKDYFLTDVERAEDKYEGGKMYLFDGSYYEVIFSWVDDNTLKAVMTVEGLPYSELWKRTTLD